MDPPFFIAKQKFHETAAFFSIVGNREHSVVRDRFHRYFIISEKKVTVNSYAGNKIFPEKRK